MLCQPVIHHNLLSCRLTITLQVDDSLPLRKSALTCVDTVLESASTRLDVSHLMRVMPSLLADKDEIKLQVHQVRGMECFANFLRVVAIV